MCGCSNENKSKCINKSCNKSVVKPKWRYCGADIACGGIKKGDSISTIITKLASVACGGDTSQLTFEEKEDCDNGGFLVKDGSGNIIFTQCYPVSTSSGTNYSYKKMDFYPDFDISGGYPLISGSTMTPLGYGQEVKLSDLDTTNLSVGEHLLMFEGVSDASGSANNGISFSYQIRVNGIPLPFSTRLGRIIPGTPSDHMSNITLNIPVTISALTDKVEVWFINHSTQAQNVSLVIIGASLTAIKK
jgi:hypothetical protein